MRKCQIKGKSRFEMFKLAGFKKFGREYVHVMSVKVLYARYVLFFLRVHNLRSVLTPLQFLALT